MKFGTRARAAVAVAVSFTVALGYYIHTRQFEETDDAQVDADITNMGPRVSGNVIAVHALENQVVHRGDLLVELDPRGLEVEVACAKADVALAEAELAAEEPTLQMTDSTNKAALTSASSAIGSSLAAVAAAAQQLQSRSAELVHAEVNDRQANVDLERAQRLLRDGAIAPTELELRTLAAQASAAMVDSLRADVGEARERLTQEEARVDGVQGHLTEVKLNAPRHIEVRKASVLARRAALEAAKAALARAELNLTYAQIASPVDGIVARKMVAVGDRVAPGQQLMAIAQVESLWVTAYFRETQLNHVHPGQTVNVHVDLLGSDLQGSVESLGGATGARLSILPPENAAANFVKVTQRVPVRVRFEPGQAGMERLRPGMSVELTVRLSGGELDAPLPLLEMIGFEWEGRKR